MDFTFFQAFTVSHRHTFGEAKEQFEEKIDSGLVQNLKKIYNQWTKCSKMILYDYW